jgi:CubicO group peptidase (beta-lactamase class C family)
MSAVPVDLAAVTAACRAVLADAEDPRYRHTSHLHVRVAGEVLLDEHLRGPLVGDVFSITKSVLSTVAGVVAAQGRLPGLDEPVAEVLPDVRGTAAQAHTWRHLLSMTRGAETEGAWDVDELTALPGGQVAHIAAAPQLRPPGQGFAYDNGACHLVSAALQRLLGEPVDDYARRELFAPLGISDIEWLRDPDGIPFGYGHLRISAADLAEVGQLWLDGGRRADRQLVDPRYLAELARPQSGGGPPEELPYGLFTWLDGGTRMMGGWAGQHLLAVPSTAAVVVVTGDPRFTFGPPPGDELPQDWAPALDLVRRHLLPLLTEPPSGRA